ncbi:methyltransferase domain-containing protein [Candidatus Gottesmanbacteria bacterium]|nr:methyltransferase domain-containing protein [Candidatus Gottesmanbacteria bacterium]
MVCLLPQKQIFHSKINGEIILFKFLTGKTLFVGGVTQSGGFTQAMWKTAIDQIRNSKFEIRNALILGIGGGTLIRLLRKYYPDISITGIEIDPVMIKIAKKYFDDKSLIPVRVIIGDATVWIRQQKIKDIFDLIIVDLYIGKFNPAGARTKDFLLRLKQLLNKQGFVIYNSHYQEDDPSEYEDFKQKCRQVFLGYEEILKYPLSRLVLLR